MYQHGRRSRFRERLAKRLSTDDPSERSQLYLFETWRARSDDEINHKAHADLVCGLRIFRSRISGDSRDRILLVLRLLYWGIRACSSCSGTYGYRDNTSRNECRNNYK